MQWNAAGLLFSLAAPVATGYGQTPRSASTPVLELATHAPSSTAISTKVTLANSQPLKKRFSCKIKTM